MTLLHEFSNMARDFEGVSTKAEFFELFRHYRTTRDLLMEVTELVNTPEGAEDINTVFSRFVAAFDKGIDLID